MEREQLHPTRVDADQRLTRRRRQTGDGPPVPLGPPRNRDEIATITADEVEHGTGLRHSLQLLIAGEVFQALLRLVQPLGGIDEPRLALYPGTLLIDIKESADSGHVPCSVQGQSMCSVSIPRQSISNSRPMTGGLQK